MAEPIKISTSQYKKSGKVDIDGHIWNVHLPGAGTELRFSQASRACKRLMARMQMLDKKVDADTATEADLDMLDSVSAEYEKNERIIFDIFKNTFRDETKDNSEVNEWIESTPTAIITLVFEDLRKQADESEKQPEQTDRSAETPAST